MHTVISAFKDRTEANAAMERLALAGFSRQDMHLEHRDAPGADNLGLSKAQWEGMEREVAVSQDALRNFGAFFTSILGLDDTTGRADTYGQHVERGSCVLVVDTHEPLDAQRCNALMREMGSLDNDLVDRTGEHHRSVRDIVADRQMTMTGLSTSDERSAERERALASERIAERDKPNR